MLEIRVEVTLEDSHPSEEEWAKNVALRKALSLVSDVAGGGSGSGTMENWVRIEPDERDGALAKIHEILEELDLANYTNVTVREIKPRAPTPPPLLPDLTSTEPGFPAATPKIVKKLLALGRRQNNQLSYDQINDLLPAEVCTTHQVDSWLTMIKNADIAIKESLEKK